MSVAPVPASVRHVEIFALLHVNTGHGGEEAKDIGSVNSTAEKEPGTFYSATAKDGAPD